MLADAEGDVAAGVRGREDAAALELGLRRLDEVGRAADHRRHEGLEGLHDLLARIARGHVLPGGELRQDVGVPRARPARVHLLPVLALRGERRRPALEPRLPLLLELDPLVDPVHVLAHLVRDDEVLIGVPAERLLGRAHLVLAERRAVRLRRVLGVGRGIRDVRAHDDQRGALRLGLRGRDRRAQRVEVVHVGDVLDVPAVRLEPLALVLAVEAERGRAVDRDPVVVVEVDELAEPEPAGDRGRLRGDALHQVAVGADRVDAVVDDLVVGAVVALPEEALGDRHPDAVREALTERAGRRLDAGRDEVLRVARGERLPLPETLQLLERKRVAGKVERGVLEDAGMAGGEHEAVAVGPGRVRRADPERLPVEQVRERRERHRGAGMTGVRLLDGVHRKRADRVDREPLDVLLGHAPNDTHSRPRARVSTR